MLRAHMMSALISFLGSFGSFGQVGGCSPQHGVDGFSKGDSPFLMRLRNGSSRTLLERINFFGLL